MEPTQELHEQERNLGILLADQFTTRELRNFLCWRRHGAFMRSELVSDPISPVDLSFSAVTILTRNGHIDREFFADLENARPRKRQAIREIAEGYGVRTLDICPATTVRVETHRQAVIESLIACATVTVLASMCGLLDSLRVMALVALLSLLRSPESTLLGARWFISYRDWVRRRLDDSDDAIGPLDGSFAGLGAAVLLIPGAIVIRVLATLRHPLPGILALDSNWRNHVLCQRLGTALELVPNTGEYSARSMIVRLRWLLMALVPLILALSVGVLMLSFISDRSENEDPSTSVGFIHLVTMFAFSSISGLMVFFAATLTFSLFLVIGARVVQPLATWGGAVLFRLSVKATAPLWLPFIFVCSDRADDRLPWDLSVEYNKNAEFPRLVRLAAWITVLMTALSIARNLIVSCVDFPAFAWTADQAWLDAFTPLPVFAAACSIYLLKYYIIVERSEILLRMGAWDLARLNGWESGSRRLIRILIACSILQLLWNRILTALGP